MPTLYPSFSTDQIAAFIELARQGNLRRAADELLITEQGLRNRLVALEERLKVELYRKARGVRRTSPLTDAGRQFLPHATAFLDRARELAELFAAPVEPQVVHIAASQYLVSYMLVDAISKFHRECPTVRIHISTRTEREVEQALLDDPGITLGVAAPYEPSPGLEYQHLFSLQWSLIVTPNHPLLRKRTIRLEDLVDQPLILLERGSTGRRHVVEAFHQRHLSPRVEMETTNTEIIVRMVEAGLGISIVPLPSRDTVTHGRKVGVRGLAGQVQPIHSGILVRRGQQLSAAGQRFVEFVRNQWQAKPAKSPLPKRSGRA